MKKSSRHFWIWAFVQELASSQAPVGSLYYFRYERYLAHPTDGDYYRSPLGRFSHKFSLYAVPLFLLIMGILIYLERPHNKSGFD